VRIVAAAAAAAAAAVAPLLRLHMTTTPEHTTAAAPTRGTRPRISHTAACAPAAQVPRLVLEYIIPVDYPKQLRRWLAAGGGNDEGCEQAGGAAALIAECRQLHPQMLTVDEWLATQVSLSPSPSPSP
jgi:hypothetical protein